VISASSASLLTRVRLGAVTGGLAAVLVLTGCSSSDDGGDKGSGDSSASATATPSDSSGPSDAKGASLDGSWLATKGGKAVALVIGNGKAALFTSGGISCNGTGGEEMGMQMIHLKCTDGSDDRSEGMVKSVSGTTLQVSWEGFGDETYTKSKDGKLPDGLPTKGLPGV
jgi:hypothetical protein